VSKISTHLNQARSNRAAFACLRVLAVGASIAVCASLAGCASEMRAASNTPSWTAVGNNGGKADRFAIARATSPDASIQVASAPAAAGKTQLGN
jgi:hypothetical protein